MVPVTMLQFFERPKELMGNEQPDDLLFFVVIEAYQVRRPCSTPNCNHRNSPLMRSMI